DRHETIVDAELAPDGQSVIALVRTESEKAKRTIVPNYVTESAYTETIPGREKVGDLVPATRIAVLSAKNGDVKWFETGLKPLEEEKPPQPVVTGAPQERQGRSEGQRTEKTEGTV